MDNYEDERDELLLLQERLRRKERRQTLLQSVAFAFVLVLLLGLAKWWLS